MTTAVDEADRSIVTEAELDAPPEMVWRALIEPDLLASWLAPDAGVAWEVLEAEPHRRLRLSWRGEDGELDASGQPLDTEVTFTLAPTQAGGTWLTVVHAGFAARVGAVAQAEIIVMPTAARSGRSPTMMGGLKWAA